MEENTEFSIEIGNRKIESLEELKELPTKLLVRVRDELCGEKLKCKKGYKMCSVNIVLGAGLVTLSFVSGAYFGSIFGGYLIGKGALNIAATKAQIKAYDKIVNVINDEISYREFGKEVFPEFYQNER